jgi:glutamine amidotransferase-like uncharacterized protein
MKKPRFLVYADHPMCSIDCADAVCEILNQSGLYDAKMFGPSSHPKLEFSSDVDCVVVPGGWGDSDQYDYRLKDTDLEFQIKDYVINGGKYLGICMGAYFAGHYYFNLLKNYKAVQYIKRNKSSTKRLTHDIVDLIWNNDGPYSTYFHDGAAFIPYGNKHGSAEIIARYTNGDIAAMIQNCNKGKVGVIGPHPEARKWWFYSQTRITDHWKDSIQEELFLDFVKRLLK